MMKRLLCLLLAAMMMLTLFACSRGGDDETPTEPENSGATEPAGDNWKIGVVTGTFSGGEEEYSAGENVLKKYGADHVVHVTYPDNFMTETETTISNISSLASDPDMKAIVITQAVPGTAAAIDKVKETRPDILFVCGVPGEDPGVIAEKADVIMAAATEEMGTAMVEKAHELGATSFVFYSFPRHMGYATIVARRDVMKEKAAELGMDFIELTAPDPTGDAGSAGAQQYITDDVPKQIEKYGVDTAFYSTNCGHQEPLIREVARGGAIFPQQCCASPYHAYPAALGIDAAGHEGDIDFMLTAIADKLEEMGNSGRMGTWPVPINMLTMEAGGEYAYEWIMGRTNGNNDTAVLTRIIKEQVAAKSADTNIDVFNYEETQADGSRLPYPNYYMLLCDYIIFGEQTAS